MKSQLLICLFLFAVLPGCCRVPGESESFGDETVNGFTVHWDYQVTREQHDTIVGILNRMVRVEGGLFLMGATQEQQLCGMTRDNEFPPHYVELSDYYICTHELTDGEIKTFTGTSIISHWYQADDYVKLLRELTGIEFDLPTEAQWEYAARGGQKSEGYIYSGSDDLDEVWTKDEDNPSTIPNELGLYNMSDGECEWCKDFYGPYDKDNSRILLNPLVESGTAHVVRGGCWRSHSTYESSQSYMEDTDIPYDTRTASHISSRSTASTYARTLDFAGNSTVRPVINIPSK